MKKIVTYLMVVTFVTVSLVSCDKKDTGGSETPTETITEIGSYGFYNLKGESVFDVKSEVNKVGVFYGFFEELTPLKGKRAIVDLVDGAKEGATVKVSVKTLGWELPSGELTCKVEKVSKGMVQLKSEKYRIVIPVKK